MSIKQKLLSPMVWGNLLAMVLVAVVLTLVLWQGMSSYTHHGESIQVPQLTGLQETDAQYRLEQLGLHAVVVDSSYNKGMAPGCVLAHTPEAGRRVKSGRNIYITVNTERTPTIALPDLADNSSLREAQAKLSAMGFRLAPVEYVHGDKDWIYGIKSAGRNVYAGERVSIDVPLVLQVGEGGDEVEEGESLNDVTIDSYDILDDVLE